MNTNYPALSDNGFAREPTPSLLINLNQRYEATSLHFCYLEETSFLRYIISRVKEMLPLTNYFDYELEP